MPGIRRFRRAHRPNYRPNNLRSCRVSRCRNPNRHRRPRHRPINRLKYRRQHRRPKRVVQRCSGPRPVCHRRTPAAGFAGRHDRCPKRTTRFSPIADLMSGRHVGRGTAHSATGNGERHVNARRRRRSTGYRNTGPAPATCRGQTDGVRPVASINPRHRPQTGRYTPLPGYG